MELEIQKKPKILNENHKLTKPEDVYNLEQIQDIKDAVQEHLLALYMDNRNNLRNIDLIGIGTSSFIDIDYKYIVRNALISSSDKVILVHNHPSNSLEPSNKDKYLSNVTYQLLKAFNIELTDHIIVTENGYTSMMSQKAINKEFKDERTTIIDYVSVLEENKKLKDEIKQLKSTRENEEEEEFE